MGNNRNESKKSLEDLKKEFQTMSDEELDTVKGGTKNSNNSTPNNTNSWNLSLGGLPPQ